jgi:hypothetical protein
MSVFKKHAARMGEVTVSPVGSQAPLRSPFSAILSDFSLLAAGVTAPASWCHDLLVFSDHDLGSMDMAPACPLPPSPFQTASSLPSVPSTPPTITALHPRWRSPSGQCLEICLSFLPPSRL